MCIPPRPQYNLSVREYECWCFCSKWTVKGMVSGEVRGDDEDYEG